MKDVSNGQRALWMALITSLAAPFFASLIVVAISLAGPLADYVLPPRGDTSLGEVAIRCVRVERAAGDGRGAWARSVRAATRVYTWLQAAVAGVLGFMAGAIIFPLPDGGSPPVLAFLAGLVAIGMRAMLVGRWYPA